ncbi:MAG: hypothetical protein ABW032_07500 [Burkholderiaceae bacterium]
MSSVRLNARLVAGDGGDVEPASRRSGSLMSRHRRQEARGALDGAPSDGLDAMEAIRRMARPPPLRSAAEFESQVADDETLPADARRHFYAASIASLPDLTPSERSALTKTLKKMRAVCEVFAQWRGARADIDDPDQLLDPVVDPVSAAAKALLRYDVSSGHPADAESFEAAYDVLAEIAADTRIPELAHGRAQGLLKLVGLLPRARTVPEFGRIVSQLALADQAQACPLDANPEMLDAAVQALFVLKERLSEDQFVYASCQFFGTVKAADARGAAVAEMLSALLGDPRLELSGAAARRMFDGIVSLANHKLEAGRRRKHLVSDARDGFMRLLPGDEDAHDRLLELCDGSPEDPEVHEGAQGFHRMPFAGRMPSFTRLEWSEMQSRVGDA